MPSELQDWPPQDESFSGLSAAKKRILELLWPMEWVEGSVIFEAVRQTYYDRRIRELREKGWQIKTVGSRYRLTSRQKLAGNVRKYPTAKQKRVVYERDKGICQICGEADEHMQYDHKVPMERLGLTEVANLQLVCRPCNVEKRGVCKRCALTTCDGCPYAYPELFGARFAIFLDRDSAERIRIKAQQRGVSEAVVASEIISDYYKKD